MGKLGHGMIIGRDLLQSVKTIIDFEYQVIKWEDTSVPTNNAKLANEQKMNQIQYFS